MKRPNPERFITEIDQDELAWLQGHGTPEGAEIIAVDEVEWYGRSYVEQSSGLYIPEDFEDTKARILEEKQREADLERVLPIGVDLFCGAGGFSLGMHEGGFDVAVASEWDPAAAHTYLSNLGRKGCNVNFVDEGSAERWGLYMKRSARRAKTPGTMDHHIAETAGENWVGSGYLGQEKREREGCREFFLGDIAKLEGEKIIDALGTDDIAVVFGGPPCQGMSTANKNRCLEDPRNGMLFHFVRLVEELKPKYFIIENVPQILTIGGGALFEAIAHKANEAGYNVVAQKLSACEFGVPQHRTRALIVGSTSGAPAFNFPMPSHWALGRCIDHKRDWSQVGTNGHEQSVVKDKKARFKAGRFEAPEEVDTDQRELFA